MAQPLYFLPNLRKEQFASIPQARAILKERGLTDVFADVPHEEITINELTGRGPGELSGVIITYQRPDGQIPRRIGFTPDEQAWTPVADGSQLWLGIDTAEQPTEADLRRKRQYGGYRIELGDGGQWLTPIIRRPDDSTELPTDMIWDATGKLVEPIKPAYLRFWEEQKEVLSWHAAGWESLPRERALALCVQALSLNYRFGRNEQNLLRIIDATNCAAILYSTVGGPDADDMEQKKTKSSQSTPSAGPGSAAITPVTDPAGQTSI